MRAGIRLTTGAELADLDSPPQYKQLAAAEKVARKLFAASPGKAPAPACPT